MKSFGQVLDENKGIGHGFDMLRIVLAVSVVIWHALVVVQGTDSPYRDSFLWLYKYSILPCFFGLSGFLVAGSAFRLSLPEFIANRSFRIFPALTMEVILSAVILGPLFTSYTLYNYFTDWQFHSYFLNLVGRIHFKLPGVFLENPSDYVNMSLWTVPFEIACYAVLATIIALGFLRRPWIMFGLVAFYFLTAILLLNFIGLPTSDSFPARVVSFIFSPNLQNTSGPSLVPQFLAGCLCYVLRYRIPYDKRLLAAAAVVLLTVALLGDKSVEIQPIFQVAILPILIFTTIFIGITNIPWPTVLKKNDYSYGIYLYGWPLQQAVVSLFPHIKNPWVSLAIAAPILVGFAAFSWHVVERPILRLRRSLNLFPVRPSAKTKEQLEPTKAESGFSASPSDHRESLGPISDIGKA